MYKLLIFKTLILYFIGIIVYRIMGKKELGQLNAIDLLISILVAELIAISILETDISIGTTLIPIIILVLIQFITSYLAIKNNKLRRILHGKATVIIKNGKLNFKDMIKLRYSLDDLLSQLRIQHVESIENVNYAVLERDGRLSIFNKNHHYPLPLILDGEIDYKVLRDIRKDIVWLNKILNERNIKLNDVFYAFYKGNKTFIIKKSDLIKNSF